MLIDTHAHLEFKVEDAKKQLQEAKAVGVEKIINIGTDIEDNPKVLEVTNNIEGIYAAIGVYPNSNRDKDLEQNINILRKQLKASDKIVAIGECGIDITEWKNQRPINEQIELFEAQVEMARSKKLPVVIHNRNGTEQVLEVLKKYKGQVKGVAHCFDESWETAKKFLDLNFYISFSGFITFNSKKYLLETVKNVPNERYLLETDSPYIVPKKVKERPNHPKNVKIVAQKVAEVKNTSLEDIAAQTTKNAENLFNL